MKKNIANYDILLFSTHGELNAQEPLNSFIVFKKDWSNDGHLTVQEIEDLKMNANLAVLSACQSGMDRGITGESGFPYGDDLFGLQRGFMKSGTTSVLATLWKADDDSSQTLVSGFFDNFIRNSENKAESLRNAQFNIIKNQNITHPYFWSHYVLSGDWD